MSIQISLMIVNDSFAWCPNAVHFGRRFLFRYADENQYLMRIILSTNIYYFFIFILGEHAFL